MSTAMHDNPGREGRSRECQLCCRSDRGGVTLAECIQQRLCLCRECFAAVLDRDVKPSLLHGRAERLGFAPETVDDAFMFLFGQISRWPVDLGHPIECVDGHHLEPAGIPSWLYAVMAYKAANAFRKEQRQHATLLRSALSLPEWRDRASSPADLSEDDAAAVRAALSRLGAVHRATLILGVCLEWSYDEIAAVCQVAEGTVKSRMSRALEALHAALSRGRPEISGGADARDMDLGRVPAWGRIILWFLDVRTRAVLLLACFYGFSYADLMEALGLQKATLATARALLHGALAAFRSTHARLACED